MSTFDPEAFMQETYDEAGDDRYVPVPEGTFNAIIEKVELRSTTGKDGKIYYPLDITYSILDDAVRQEMGLEGEQKALVRQSIFLQFNAAGNKIDFGPGKNVPLGQLRKALGQNDAKQAWNVKMMEGAGPVQIVVKQTVDKEDPDKVYSNVKKVGIAA